MTTIFYNLLFTMREGIAVLAKNIRFLVIYMVFVVTTWAFQMYETNNNPDIYFPMVLRTELIMVYILGLFALIAVLGGIIHRAKVFNAFQKIGFYNRQKETPILRKILYYKNNLVELHFLSKGIALNEWKKQQLALENALNITISEIKYGKGNCQNIIVKACMGRMDFYSSLSWNDKNQTDYFSASLILGMSMGQLVYNDLRINPHMLIGGATGSGKTLLLKHILLQCIHKEYRIVILDYKGGVDFSADMWHIHTSVLLDKNTMLKGLNSIVNELQYRQRVFSEEKCANIDEYNSRHTKLPRIIVACDEISDLLDVTGLSKEEKELTKEIHAHLNTLIRKGRAFGIHLFLATQRPAADVVGGALKNNASCRIAGKCDEVLSRMILDDSIAADMVPKDSVGVFVNQDGIVFKGFVFDENENIEIPFRWHGEGDLRATSGCAD